jgi:hypothetical protein
VTFLVCLLTIVKLTAWGRAQASALDTVIGIIERVGAVDVKVGVAESDSALSATAKDAIKDSVAKADPKKTPKSLIYRIIREIFREPVSGL